MAAASSLFKLIRAARMIDGCGGPPLEQASVLVEGSTIRAVGPAHEVVPPTGAGVEVFDYPDATVLPGLIDVHTHLNGFGDGRLGDDLATLPDELLLLQAARNARTHLASGVTTVRDCGAKGRTAFLLREASRLGIVEGPRLVLSGRPVTITGGHMWYFGAEADGVDGVRRAVRQLVKEGADFIKIVATGGSTRTSFPTRPALNADEVRAIVDEAHKFGKPTAAHCTSTQGILHAVDAGVDTIIHCVFREPDSTTQFRPEVAESMAARGCWVDFTIAQSGRREHMLRARAEHGNSLTAAERAELAQLVRARAERQDHFQRLLTMGVKMVSGSDSAWAWYPSGGFQYEVIGHADWGMPNLDAILTGTRDAAACVGLGDRVGTLEPGKEADILIVAGDPSRDIQTLLDVKDVFLAGRRVPHVPMSDE